MTRPLIITAITALLLGLLALAFLLFYPLRSDQIMLKVRSGDNATVIANVLKQNGIIRSRTVFLTLAKLKRSDRRLKAGSYTLGGHYSTLQTLNLLEKGHTTAIKVTFPEGLSLHATLKRIERSGLADYGSLYHAATDTALVRRLTGIQAPSLEGFLYPDTYLFALGIGPEQILALLTREFFSKLAGAGIDPQAVPDFYRKLILASIVERESGSPDEMETIAGVFSNRLGKGMRLESCPTVDYILERQGIKREVLTLEDINLPSPYNTYRNDGLPPGPICNPSLRAIQAALAPAKTKYLYFVADRQGRNDFSVTFAEHLLKSSRYSRLAFQRK
jgi:UPF0755 protein